MQWAGADSRITSGQVQKPLPLSDHAAVDTVGYTEGDEEAKISLKYTCDPIRESQHLDT